MIVYGNHQHIPQKKAFICHDKMVVNISPLRNRDNALLRFGCTLPRTCSTLTSDFSAPNLKDMNFL